MTFWFIVALFGGCITFRRDASVFHPVPPVKRILYRGGWFGFVAVGVVVFAVLFVESGYSNVLQSAVGAVCVLTGWTAGKFLVVFLWGGEARECARLVAIVAKDDIGTVNRLIELRHPSLQRQVEDLSSGLTISMATESASSALARARAMAMAGLSFPEYRWRSGDNVVDIALRNGAVNSLQSLLRAGYRPALRRDDQFGPTPIKEAQMHGFTTAVSIANAYGIRDEASALADPGNTEP